jgi:TetR/AcrR family transcriptional regulator, transcriptional repressor for nem operon
VAPADVDTLTAKGRATRGRIVAAAAESMMARGVERTTIQDVMAAAAVSGSQMYHYFANKADLVAAVIDFATDGVLSVQQMGLDRISELSETDPPARARLARSFGLWENVIRDGLVHIAVSDVWSDEIDVERVALALLAAVQGGLLLSQVRRETAPLEAAIDSMIKHLTGLGTR